jgi:hypothetical protein
MGKGASLAMAPVDAANVDATYAEQEKKGETNVAADLAVTSFCKCTWPAQAAMDNANQGAF